MNEEALAQDYLVSYLEADAELMATANAVTIGVRWARLPSPFVKVDRLAVPLTDHQDVPHLGRSHLPRACCASLGRLRSPGLGNRERSSPPRRRAPP